MLGTAFETQGGISAVVNVYRGAGLFERWPVLYLATHCDGSRLKKLAVGVGSLLHFLALVLASRVAVVHAHTSSGASFWRKSVFLLVAFVARRPVIFHLHGGGFPGFCQRIGPLGRRIVRWVIDHSSLVIVLSNQWVETMAGISGNRRVRVLLNPVALPRPAGTRREEHTLLFLGRITEAKGIHELLAAMAQLRGEFPNLRLICAGEGDFDLSAAMLACGVEDLVERPGWVAGEAKAASLARAAVFVLPSYFEGLPMGVLEAMATGMTVVATRVGGVPDAITDGVDGLLVPAKDPRALADSLRRVLADAGLRTRLGETARATVVERFSAEVVVAQLEVLYAEMGIAPRRASDDGAPAPRFS